MTFTPGSDEGRTDTFEAQTAEPDRSIDKKVKEEFDDAQNILTQTGEALYGLGLAGIYAITKSPDAVQAVNALRRKLEGKPFTPPTPNPNNLGGLVTLEPITTEEAFTRPYVTGRTSEGFDRDLPPVTDGPTNYIYQMYGGSVTPEQKRAISLIKAKMQGEDPEDIPKKGFNPDITKKNLQLFNEIGFTGTNKLDIQDMLYGIDETGQPLMSQYKRRVLKAGIGDETFNWSAFTQNRDEVVKDFLDGLQDLNIDPKTIHGHHISALRITSSLFDGLSPIQRKKLIKVFQREGLQLGNHPANLLALHKSTHLEVVHPFLEQQVGKYGQLLMDPAKLKKLNPRQREGLVKKFAKIIKRSEEIAMENTQTWLSETFENMSPKAAFDAKLDILNKAFDNDITFRKQLLKSVKSKEPLLPFQAEDVEIPDTPKTKKTRVTSKKTKFKNLLKKIKTENPNSKQMTIWDISEEALDAYRQLF